MSFERSDAGDGVCVVTFNRPPANAITRVEIDEVGELCAELESDVAVRAVVLRSAGKVFSAGLDLKAMMAGGLEQVVDLGADDGLFALWTLSKPTIAEVGGHAIAGGAVLALACDERILADAKYGVGLVETAVGVPFPRGAFEISRHALGGYASQWLLQAQVVSPKEALATGFAQALCPPDELSERVLKRARLRASYEPSVYAFHKRVLQQPALDRLRAETEDERAARHARFLSDTTRQAVEKAAR